MRDEHWDERAEFLAGWERLLPGSNTLLADLLQEVDSSFDEFAPILKLPVPERSLSQWIIEAAVS